MPETIGLQEFNAYRPPVDLGGSDFFQIQLQIMKVRPQGTSRVGVTVFEQSRSLQRGTGCRAYRLSGFRVLSTTSLTWFRASIDVGYAVRGFEIQKSPTSCRPVSPLARPPDPLSARLSFTENEPSQVPKGRFQKSLTAKSACPIVPPPRLALGQLSSFPNKSILENWCDE